MIAEGVWTARKLALRYESWKRTSTRTVGPLGLVLKAGIWHLVALMQEQPRSFRVAKVLDVQALDDKARRPRSFDLAAYWGEAIRRFERELYRGEATVLTTPQGLKALRYISSAVARAVAAALRASTIERIKSIAKLYER